LYIPTTYLFISPISQKFLTLPFISIESYISPNVFQDIFPLSLEELVHISSDLSPHDSYTFAPTHTKSPGLAYSTEVLPVFFVTSLCSSYLQPLLDQLLYPALCSRIPGQVCCDLLKGEQGSQRPDRS
jgi:hypothetical protein